MKISVNNIYDFVPEDNGAQQPLPAPMPYAEKPRFLDGFRTSRFRMIGRKILGNVAALGLVLNIAVKTNDGRMVIKPIEIADDAQYFFDINGKRYAVTADDLLGFGIYNEKNKKLNALPMSEDMHEMITHLAAVDGNPNELSPKDIQLVNTQNLGLSSHKVTHIPYNDKPSNYFGIKIERLENGQPVSYCDINVLNQPTAHYK